MNIAGIARKTSLEAHFANLFGVHRPEQLEKFLVTLCDACNQNDVNTLFEYADVPEQLLLVHDLPYEDSQSEVLKMLSAVNMCKQYLPDVDTKIGLCYLYKNHCGLIEKLSAKYNA